MVLATQKKTLILLCRVAKSRTRCRSGPGDLLWWTHVSLFGDGYYNSWFLPILGKILHALGPVFGFHDFRTGLLYSHGFPKQAALLIPCFVSIFYNRKKHNVLWVKLARAVPHTNSHILHLQVWCKGDRHLDGGTHKSYILVNSPMFYDLH